MTGDLLELSSERFLSPRDAAHIGAVDAEHLGKGLSAQPFCFAIDA
jgi:hypothetical protein